jgi:thiosulfate reductase cytochrome b subunit
MVFTAKSPRAATPVRQRYYRHRLPVRIMHWTNVMCLTVLFMSGLGIFNAHPALYWGDSSYSSRPAFLEIGSAPADGLSAGTPDSRRGMLRIGTHVFDTTGYLGVLPQADGSVNLRAFPSWITIPGYYSLAYARRWHFFFAWLFVLNGIAYLSYSIFSRHLGRDLLPDANDWRGIGASVRDHLLFRHPRGNAAKRYNVLQKLAYLAVIFVLLPLIALMGMAMSPMLDSVMTGWVDWFGGRQSARSIHFIIAWLLVAFVAVHVFEVIVSGLWNHLRSMITGSFEVLPDSSNEVHRERS